MDAGGPHEHPPCPNAPLREHTLAVAEPQTNSQRLRFSELVGASLNPFRDSSNIHALGVIDSNGSHTNIKDVAIETGVTV